MKNKLSKPKKESLQSTNSSKFLNFKDSQKRKLSQGEVVSTVLLILLVIVASTILIGFVIPLVNNILGGTKCNDYMGKITITNNEKYSCYDNLGKKLLLQLKLDNMLEKSKALQIIGLRIIVETAGTDSKSFEINPPNSNPTGSIIMGNGETNLIIPNVLRTEVTYNISGIDPRPNSTLIYPILSGGKSCANAAYSLDFIPYCK